MNISAIFICTSLDIPKLNISSSRGSRETSRTYTARHQKNISKQTWNKIDRRNQTRQIGGTVVKDLKKKICPQFVKMKTKIGIHVQLIKRAETIAEYLETEHWKNESQHDGPSRARILQTNSAILTNFSLQELKCALKTTKANKQPA